MANGIYFRWSNNNTATFGANELSVDDSGDDDDYVSVTVDDVSLTNAIEDTKCLHTIDVDKPFSHNCDPKDGNDKDTSSECSGTSTIEHPHEPFSALAEKVIKLIIDLFPGHTEKDIAIERLKGDGLDCIIGIQVSQPGSKLPWYDMSNIGIALATCMLGKPRQSPKAKMFILRIPREPVHNLHYQYITLAFLARKVPYPVPRPIVTDSGNANALGRAYMLQNRLPGQPLPLLWPSLTPEQRTNAVEHVCKLTRNLYTVKHRCPGVISIRNTTGDLAIDLVKIEPFPMPNAPRPTPFTAPLASPQTTRDLLLDLCARQRTHASHVPAFPHIWTGFERMACKLHDLGLIPDGDAFHLFHPSLRARHLLFTLSSPTCVELTGVLDWDAAIFAPRFVSARAPCFMWPGEEEMEENCVVEAGDAERKMYKNMWEAEVGEERTREAYCIEYVLARRMWWIVSRGIRSGRDVREADEVLALWGALYPE
jgi:aminoglycoside phosphotransferase (APT) family kinase protein